MPGAAPRLSMDIGSARTKTVLTLDGGGRLPLMPDGAPFVHSSVFIEPDGTILVGAAARSAAMSRPGNYIASPASLVSQGPIDVDGKTFTASEVFAAILSFVRTDATRIAGRPITAVTLVVPPQWGRVRRDILREAARLAGFTDTTLVAAAAATAMHLATSGVHLNDGDCVLVCDAGAGSTDLTVLEQTRDGLQQLATAAVDGAAGRDVDQLVAAHLLCSIRPPGDEPTLDESDPQWQAIVTAAEDAKTALSDREHTAVAIRPGYPALVLDRTELAKLVGPAMEGIVAQVAEVLAAADITPTHVTHVVLAGGGARLPGIDAALARAVGQRPYIPARPDLAAADGALPLTPTAAAAPAEPAPLPRVSLRPGDLVRPALFALGSVALIASVFVTLWTTRSSGRTYVHLANELISAAAVVAVLAAWSVAQLLPTLYLAGKTVHDRDTIKLISVAFTGVAALGIAIAAIYGLGVGALVGATTTEYLAPALKPAVLIAVCAFLIAVLARAIPGPALARWLAQLRHPLIAVILAAAGIIAMRYAGTAQISAGLSGMILRAGGAATGVAIAFTVVRNRLLRIITAGTLGLGGFAVASLANNRPITLAYLAAVIWWSATRLAVTGHAAYPTLRDHLRKLLPPRAT
ncbi:Hsp70 family protein [Asanoa sp. NPDC050611]|uniref:Hsp70 family protein n=1 Tax=Asanoa sp. NPDC050611 TaxID=3157098 RepID=UPI0033FBAE8D